MDWAQDKQVTEAVEKRTRNKYKQYPSKRKIVYTFETITSTFRLYDTGVGSSVLNKTKASLHSVIQDSTYAEYEPFDADSARGFFSDLTYYDENHNLVYYGMSYPANIANDPTHALHTLYELIPAEWAPTAKLKHVDPNAPSYTQTS